MEECNAFITKGDCDPSKTYQNCIEESLNAAPEGTDDLDEIYKGMQMTVKACEWDRDDPAEISVSSASYLAVTASCLIAMLNTF